jgi:hypothetical protein
MLIFGDVGELRKVAESPDDLDVFDHARGYSMSLRVTNPKYADAAAAWNLTTAIGAGSRAEVVHQQS